MIRDIALLIIGLILVLLLLHVVTHWGDPPELAIEAIPAKQYDCLLPNPPRLAPGLPMKRPRNERMT